MNSKNALPEFLVSNLRISTSIRLHPDFVEDAARFARRLGVRLLAMPEPEASYKNNPQSREKDATLKANIHLVRFGAIRLFTKQEAGELWIQSIDLNPSLLLPDSEGRPLTPAGLQQALSTALREVAPLLANPRDALHVIPGLATGTDRCAHWSRIESEVFLRDILLRHFHDLSHPETGAAQGTSETRIRLQSQNEEYTITLEQRKERSEKSRNRQREPNPLRVRLSIDGSAVPGAYMKGKTCLIDGSLRLVGFDVSQLGRVHQEAMSRLVGIYVPAPAEWRDEGKPVTHARVLALLSVFTPFSMEELREMDEECRQPSQSTRTRLNTDIRAEARRLKPVPVASLFKSEMYEATDECQLPDHEIDPRIAEAYEKR